MRLRLCLATFYSFIFFLLASIGPLCAEVSEAERQVAREWISTSFETAGNEPFSFLYQNRSSVELLKSWQRSYSKTTLDGQRVRHSVSYVDRSSALTVRVDVIEYLAFAATEWTLFFRNGASVNSAILESIQPLHARLGPANNLGDFIVDHANGSGEQANDFAPRRSNVTRLEPLLLRPFGGRSSGGGGPHLPFELGALPFFSITYPTGGGVAGGIGWSGQWNAAFSRTSDLALEVKAGMERTRFYLRPGEEVRTPSILLSFWLGTDQTRGQRYLRKLLLQHYSPRVRDTIPRPPIAVSTDGTLGSWRNDAWNMREIIEAIARHQLPFDTFWVDATWFNWRRCDRAHLRHGDFNGDGALDLICHSDDGRYFVALSDKKGSFRSPGWWPSAPGTSGNQWCDPAHLRHGDFNGDGALDLICHSDDGRHLVAFSTKDGTFRSPGWWPSAPGTSGNQWCDPAHLRHGDFNGDGALDLTCHHDRGQQLVAFANKDGTFNSRGWWINAVTADWALTVGNFEPDPMRYPNGLRPVADAARRAGLRFLMWFEPERAMPNTWMFENRLNWLIRPPPGMPFNPNYMFDDGFHLVNLGIPEARAWLRQKISSMIGEIGVDIYRQDFNMYPLYYWRSQDAPDRAGITEIRYVMGLYELLDGLKEDHPNLIIDICASGGRRIDFEMLKRGFALTRTDKLWSPSVQQNHTYGISRWIPITGIGADSSEPKLIYGVRSGMGVHAVFPFNGFARSDETTWATYRHVLDEVVSLREHFLGDFSPLTPPPGGEDSCVAWQFHREELGTGLVQLFRRESCPNDVLSVRLKGLIGSREYLLKDLDNNSTWRLTGDQLMAQGLTVRLPLTRTAKSITFALD